MIFVNRIESDKLIAKLTSIKMIIILFTFINCHAIAQNILRSQFDYANMLFTEEQYFDAITEFKRAIFFDTLKQCSFEANRQIAYCYKQGGKFNEAIHYFALAELSAPNPDSLFDIKIEIIKINLLRGTTYRAFELLNDLNNNNLFIQKKKQIIYWRGWAYIFNDEWEEASNEFALLEGCQELKLLCENVYKSKYSVTKAKILSYILPGAGQFYTGNYISGIISFSWVALWTCISVDAFLAERIFDGIMVTDFLTLRFYSGNFQNAEKFAAEQNAYASNWMLNYLQNNYRGPKP